MTGKKSHVALRCGVISPFSCGFPPKIYTDELEIVIGPRLSTSTMAFSGNVYFYCAKLAGAGVLVAGGIRKGMSVVNTKKNDNFTVNYEGNTSATRGTMRDIPILKCSVKTVLSSFTRVQTSTSSSFSLIRVFSSDAKSATMEDDAGIGEVL